MNKSSNKRVFRQQPTELNSTTNPLDLITPSQTDTSSIPQISPVVTSQVVKRNPELNAEIAKTTLQQINQISSLNNNNAISNSTQNNVENSNQISINPSIANSTLNNNTALSNMYNNNSSIYGGLGGYGSGMGYGGYGSSNGLGGYGSMYGGYGGYGGMYGANGMRGLYGRNPNDSPDFFEKSFMAIEKINFHIYNFCEMVRMMQNQGPAMHFLYDMIKKGFTGTRMFFTDTAVQFISNSKLKLINSLMYLRKFMQEFFMEKDLSNEKLKKHIRILDMVIIILLISAFGGLFLKIY